jgi:hypothetical protein
MWWATDCKKGTGRELVVAPKMTTWAVDFARYATSSSVRSPEFRWILSTGRPGTMTFASWEEPINWDKRGSDARGRAKRKE